MDLDGDGRTDILSGSWPGELYFFRRNSDGSFAAAEQLRDKQDKPIKLGSASSVFAVDWDAGGTLDLLVGNISGDVHLVPGEAADGKLSFGAPQPLFAAGQPIKIAVGDSAPVAADWDSDGLLDLVVGTENGSVLWFRNVGTARQPQLEAARTLVGESPCGWKGDDSRARGDWGLRVKPCVVDWNGDGRLDLLLGDRCGSFQAKPSQTAAEQEEERAANDRLPDLRKGWAAAFAEYQKLQSSPEGSASAKRIDELREKMRQLKDEIARVQEIQSHYQPGHQSHGFVWLFLRKPASATTDR